MDLWIPDLWLSAFGKVHCRDSWFAALSAHQQAVVTRRDAYLAELLACPPERALLIRPLAPDDTIWAERVWLASPADVEALFWLADALLQSNPVQAALYYSQGLAIKPSDARRWLIYGDVLRYSDPGAAIQAYRNACRLGDPGSNGCYRAGLTAERLGEYQKAIHYYRLSRWEGAHRRADNLEARLEAGESP